MKPKPKAADAPAEKSNAKPTEEPAPKAEKKPSKPWFQKPRQILRGLLRALCATIVVLGLYNAYDTYQVETTPKASDHHHSLFSDDNATRDIMSPSLYSLYSSFDPLGPDLRRRGRQAMNHDDPRVHKRTNPASSRPQCVSKAESLKNPYSPRAPTKEETHYVLHPRRTRTIRPRNVLPPRPRPRVDAAPPRRLAALVRPRARPRPRRRRHVFRTKEGPRRPGLAPIHDRVRPIYGRQQPVAVAALPRLRASQ